MAIGARVTERDSGFASALNGVCIVFLTRAYVYMSTRHKAARAVKNGGPGKLATPQSGQQSTNQARGLTTVPIEQDSDWVRLPKPGHTLCGLGRTYLFQLTKRGKIKSVALREPGKARGVRLLYKPSILAFIEGQSAIQNATPAEAAR